MFGHVTEISRTLERKWISSILKSVARKEAIWLTKLEKSLQGIGSTMLSQRLLELE